MVEKIVCPEGHTRVWAKGLVPSRSGPKQRYVCFTCGRSFYKPKPEPKAVAKKAGTGKPRGRPRKVR